MTSPAHGALLPVVKRFLTAIQDRPIEFAVETLCFRLKCHQIAGPLASALATVHVLRHLVERAPSASVDELIAAVRETGSRIAAARPRELAVGNVVRRVLSLIRDEAIEERNDDAGGTGPSPSAYSETEPHTPAEAQAQAQAASQADGGGGGGGGGGVASSLNMYMSTLSVRSDRPGAARDFGAMSQFRLEVVEGIDELHEEIVTADESIAAAADTHIHPDDTVLLYNPTPTVERFIARAAQKRSFTVYIAGSPGAVHAVSPFPSRATEAEPSRREAFKARLAKTGTKVVSLIGANVMAYMPGVTKVVLSARSVCADGTVIADASAGIAARAAHRLRVPLIMLAASYVLGPTVPILGGDELVEWAVPSGFEDGGLVSSRVKVRKALTEVIGGDLIDVYVTSLGGMLSSGGAANDGSFARTYLISAIEDQYYDEDLDLGVDFGL